MAISEKKILCTLGDVYVQTSDLDREKKSFYIYTVEAEDGAPTGRRGKETVLGEPNRSMCLLNYVYPAKYLS